METLSYECYADVTKYTFAILTTNMIFDFYAPPRYIMNFGLCVRPSVCPASGQKFWTRFRLTFLVVFELQST